MLVSLFATNKEIGRQVSVANVFNIPAKPCFQPFPSLLPVASCNAALQHYIKATTRRRPAAFDGDEHT
jgi:hypothetical protein